MLLQPLPPLSSPVQRLSFVFRTPATSLCGGRSLCPGKVAPLSPLFCLAERSSPVTKMERSECGSKQSCLNHLRQVATIPTAFDLARRYVSSSNFIWVRSGFTILWIRHFDVISALAIRGGLHYSASWDRTFNIWRLSDFRCLQSVQAHDDAVHALIVSVDGAVYTGSADGSIKIWAGGLRRRHTLMAT